MKKYCYLCSVGEIKEERQANCLPFQFTLLTLKTMYYGFRVQSYTYKSIYQNELAYFSFPLLTLAFSTKGKEKACNYFPKRLQAFKIAVWK